jgi:glycosyltransferase involved in cell wall biosynthesis
MNRIIFWEPTPSPHKFALFEAIAALRPDIEIHCVADHTLGAGRVALGWEAALPAHGFQLAVAPSEKVVCEYISHEPEKTLHVFAGIRNVPLIAHALKKMKNSAFSFQLGVMSEPRVSNDGKGMLRWLESVVTEKWIRRHAQFILAIGRNGPRWFEKTFYRKEKIFPFAYFLDMAPPVSSSISTWPCTSRPDNFQKNDESLNSIKVGYLGRLVQEKGAAVFLQAISDENWPDRFQVEIAGAGDMQGQFESLMHKCPKKVKYLGVLPMQKIPEFLKGLDVLVAPSVSDNDGWGAVVSEALMNGVAVVATPCVGASIVLDHVNNGVLIQSGVSEAIRPAIEQLIATNALTPEARRMRQSYASSHLSAQKGANYFWDILAHVFEKKQAPLHFYTHRP